jgi:hypothetical protein
MEAPAVAGLTMATVCAASFALCCPRERCSTLRVLDDAFAARVAQIEGSGCRSSVAKLRVDLLERIRDLNELRTIFKDTTAIDGRRAALRRRLRPKLRRHAVAAIRLPGRTS